MSKGSKRVRKALAMLFGNIQWAAPPWLRKLSDARQQHPRGFKAGIAAVIVIPLLLFGAYQLWQLLPQPVLTQVTVEAPGVTPVGDDGTLYPPPLTLQFHTRYADARDEGPRTAARLELLDKDLSQGVSLQPAHVGTWRWLDENTLRFEPEDDWPAGQEYTVTLAPELFADGIELADDGPTFTTPRIEASLRKLAFYQNPEDPSEHSVVATLGFTHSVDVDSLKDHLSLSMRKEGATIDVAPTPYAYEVTTGKQGREAYITSVPLTLPEQENFMALTVAPGVAAELGSSVTESSVSSKVRIPSISSFFRVESIDTRIIRNKEGKPEQTLVIEFTDGVQTDVISEEIEAWELPDNQYWSRDEVDEALLSRSRQLTLRGNPSAHEYARLQSFVFDASEGKQVLIKLPAGLKSQGKFIMTVPYTTLLRAPNYPREARIVGEGALLAMTGDRTLSLQARGVPALRVELFRLMDDQVNHLVTQTHGDLASASFNYNFNETHMSERFERVLPLQAKSPADAAYASLDLAPFLKSAGRGMFVVRVEGWDPANKRSIYGADDRRLVLLTDLSIIVKNNSDNTHSLFVHSLDQQMPVADAVVELLGLNGLPIVTARTDAQGHVDLPDVSGFSGEKQPAVYLVRKGGDIAFLPFERYERKLDYSRFETGGQRTFNDDEQQLNAAVFSDRGIYRPGEQGHLGVMVKQDDWQPVQGVPIEITLTDPRNNVVKKETLALPADGFVEMPFAFAVTDPTGEYRAQVFLLDEANNHYRRQLGMVSISVEEFQPDTMRIRTHILDSDAPGWQTPLQFQAQVTLENLFGLPAQDRRVQASYNLQPTRFHFQRFADYVFEDPFREDENRLTSSVSEQLPEALSNVDGQARFSMDLSGYGRGLFRLNFEAEGYETGGGRSVTARSSTLVSPAEQLVGWKADGDLNYLRRNAERNLSFIAANPQLEAVALDGLTLEVQERRSISTLVRQNDGTLAYQTIVKPVAVSETAFAIAAGGSTWSVPTTTAGDYSAVIKNAEDLVLAKVDFTVAGASNLGGNLEKTAELNIKLDKSDYRSGEEIELQITAPYTGAGLITIERDRVYAFKWFRTDTTRSVQRIRVPEELEGNGYVNITFVRSLESEEIFTQPLSYAVAPFNVDRSARTVDIALSAPDKVKPGTELTITYQTSRPARIAVFAVDEGVLQVANYDTPQPLDTFLRKRALQVSTAQMADLLMPEFRLLREVAAAGGGSPPLLSREMLNKNLNPFQRGIKAPVVFWSGILEATGAEQTVSFTVPDHFDGQLRLMAVASAAQAAGSAQASTLVRGPFVLQPNLITSAAPGDTFEVSVGVTNALPAENGRAAIEVSAVPSKHLEVVGELKQQLELAPGQESRARFQVKATEHLGGAELVFHAVSGEHSISRTATVSVRPAVPHRTSLKAGISTTGKGELTLDRELKPELAEQEATLGYSPLILATGLQTWLEAYPHACTEQIVSRVFPMLALTGDPIMALDRESTLEQYRNVIGSLQARQHANGAFSFWPGLRYQHVFASIYAMHFLTDAAALDITVPADMQATGLEYLRTLAAAQPQNHRTYEQAYAIYVLTRNGRVTTNYLTQLQEYLEKQQSTTWRQELTASYMAASYQLLKLNDLAQKLIDGYSYAKAGSDFERDMDSALARNAQYVYLLAQHFPEKLAALDDAAIQRLVMPISEGRYNTLSSAYTILALGAWGAQAADAASSAGEPLQISAATDAASDSAQLAQGTPPVLRHAVPVAQRWLAFAGGNQQRLFYTATQSGYDAQLPTQVISDGLEIVREYLDADGNVVTSAVQGSELTVRLRVRALDNRQHDNIAVVDLLPGGFEVQRDSIRDQNGTDNQNGSSGPKASWATDYQDIREDRVVLYGTVDSSVSTFTYKVKLSGVGTFTIPPGFAESMYKPHLQAQSLAGEFEVTRP